MLAEFTPSIEKGVFRSPFLNALQDRNIWEVGRFPAYFTDDRCKELIMRDRQMIHYVSMQGGIWLATWANKKSLLCDLENIQPGKSYAFSFDELNELK